MLQGLYKIISFSDIGESSYIAEVEVNQGDSVFAGHFPGHPVLPGVCSVNILKDCVCRSEGKKLRFSEISQCKFTGMVDPAVNCNLKVKFSTACLNTGHLVKAIMENDDRVVLKMTAIMVEDLR